MNVSRNDVFDDACTCFGFNKHLPVLIQGTNFYSAGYALHVCPYEYALYVLIMLLVMRKVVYSSSFILVFPECNFLIICHLFGSLCAYTYLNQPTIMLPTIYSYKWSGFHICIGMFAFSCFCALSYIVVHVVHVSRVRNTCNQYLCIFLRILLWLILYFYLHVALTFPSFWYYNARRDVLIWWTSGCIYVRVLYEFACNQITCRRCSNIVRSVCMNKACFWWSSLYAVTCVVYTRVRSSSGVVWSV